MRKAVWVLLLVTALGAAGWFVGVPMAKKYWTETALPEVPLKSAEEARESFAEEGWVRQEKFVYQRRDIPSLEADFQKLGYPPFLYLAEEDGTVGRSGERSYHEDGMALFLYMDETYYLTRARLEYTVSAERFSSTAMERNIRPFYDFAEIITGRELEENDRTQLLREFAELFNDAEHKPRKNQMNDLEFTISLDSFYMLIQMSC